MQLHELQPKTPSKGSKRIGRGRGSGKGKTSGRGTKGQKARAGHKMMPAIREILKKLPKRRGYSQRSIEEKPAVVNLSALEVAFGAGETVSPKTLMERGLVRARKGKMARVKILGTGELTKKLVFAECNVSGSAKEKIEKSGGSIVAPEKKEEKAVVAK